MRKLALLLLVLVTLSGCGVTLQAGVERGPAPAAAQGAAPAPRDALLPTVEALQRENQRLLGLLEAGAAPATPDPPDLGRVAYVRGGDIWVKRLPDGEPQRLTTDGRNSQPDWSASHRWLAYRKERAVVLQVECDLPEPNSVHCRESVLQHQLWVIEAGDGSATAGTARQLNGGLTVAAFAWSPTGDQLAYVDAAGTLYVTDANGRSPSALAGGPGRGAVAAGASAIAWSPDGNWLAFEFARERPGSGGPEHGIWKIAPAGADPVPLYVDETGQAEPRLAGWSPSGQSILFWPDGGGRTASASGTALFRMDARGGSGSRAPARAGGDMLVERMLPNPGFVAPAPAAAAGQARDTVAAVEGAGEATWHGKQITLLDAIAGARGSRSLTGPDVAAIYPAWSSDGARLAYAAMPDQAGIELDDPTLPDLMERRIWVSAPAGGPPEQLTRDPGYRDEFPAWSTDGRSVLFARLDAAGHASLWVVPASGGAPAKVVEEITPAPDPLAASGYIPWAQYFAWTRGS